MSNRIVFDIHTVLLRKMIICISSLMEDLPDKVFFLFCFYSNIHLLIFNIMLKLTFCIVSAADYNSFALFYTIS